MRRTALALTSTILLVVLAAPALAAGDAEEHGPSVLLQALNLALLLGALTYFARKPLSEYFQAHRDTVKSEMSAAGELLSEAERKNSEWQRKLSELDAELEGIRSSTRQRAEDERAHILAEAMEGAERIQRDAAAAVEQEMRKARSELRREVATLASRLAAEQVSQRMTDGDRQRLVDEFIADIGRSGARN